MPRTTAVKNGFSMSETIAAQTLALCRRNARAEPHGTYSSAAAALSTRVARSLLTPPVPFSTRDTVAGDVSAAFATSVIFVTRDFMFIAASSPAFGALKSFSGLRYCTEHPDYR